MALQSVRPLSVDYHRLESLGLIGNSPTWLGLWTLDVRATWTKRSGEADLRLATVLTAWKQIHRQCGNGFPTWEPRTPADHYITRIWSNWAQEPSRNTGTVCGHDYVSEWHFTFNLGTRHASECCYLLLLQIVLDLDRRGPCWTITCSILLKTCKFTTRGPEPQGNASSLWLSGS